MTPRKYPLASFRSGLFWKWIWLAFSSPFLAAQVTHTVETAVFPAGAGMVTGSGVFADGESVTLSATAMSGYLFSGWSGSALALDNPLTVEVLKDLHYTAQFVPDTRDLDSDGLNQFEEAKVYGTNPAKPDTDDDGFLDGAEVVAGTDPLFDEEGALLAYEGFDFAANMLLATQSGTASGTGWGAPWGPSADGTTNINGAVVRPGSLTRGDLETEGAHLFLSGLSGNVRLARELETPFTPTEGGSLYFSWIAQRQGDAQDPATTAPPNPFPRGVDLRFWDGIGDVRLNMGNLSNQTTNTWKVVARDTTFDTGISFTESQNLFVLRIDFTPEGTADLLHLWVNPDLAAPENLSLAQTMERAEESREPWKLEEVTAIGFFVGDASGGRPHGELIVDEMRLGTGYRSVLPRIGNPLDADKDDLENSVESNTGIFVSNADTGTDPNKADSDDDGLSDGAEVLLYGSDPNRADTDRDGLTDGAEVLTHGSSPLLTDTDGDTFTDALEVSLSALGFDPAVDSSALITLVARNALSYGLFRRNDVTTLLANGIAIEANPAENGLTLYLDLWVSETLSDWSLLDLSEGDVRGTESGLEVHLPPPTVDSFYQVEIEAE